MSFLDATFYHVLLCILVSVICFLFFLFFVLKYIYIFYGNLNTHLVGPGLMISPLLCCYRGRKCHYTEIVLVLLSLSLEYVCWSGLIMNN